VLSEREVSASLSGRDVLVEAGLAPEAGAELHSRRLGAFRVQRLAGPVLLARSRPGAEQVRAQRAVARGMWRSSKVVKP